MQNKVNVFICHYNFNEKKNTCRWLLTIDEDFANTTDQSYQLASYDDLYYWMAATNQVFQGIITVAEGDCKWVEEDYLDFLGNICWRCEYEFVWQ